MTKYTVYVFPCIIQTHTCNVLRIICACVINFVNKLVSFQKVKKVTKTPKTDNKFDSGKKSIKMDSEQKCCVIVSEEIY